jgi:hypothetical protein
MAKQLFSIPIPSTNGTFTCTIPSSENSTIYLLTFTSPADNRLIPEFLDSFLLALDILEHNYPKGVLITTSGIQKFFSNGLDLEKALSSPGFFERHLYTLFRRLLTYVTPRPNLFIKQNQSSCAIKWGADERGIDIPCQRSHLSTATLLPAAS